MVYFSMVTIGAFAGLCSGLFGIGGGVVIVPLLTVMLGFTQHTANGTSLVALLLPVGILGVWEYFKNDRISLEHVRFGLWLALGMFLGVFFGSKLALLLPDKILKKIFAFFLMLVSLHLFIKA